MDKIAVVDCIAGAVFAPSSMRIELGWGAVKDENGSHIRVAVHVRIVRI